MNINYKSIILAIGLFFASSVSISAAPGDHDYYKVRFQRAPEPASTITVTNTNDSGAGSLRQAIADAAPGDTINFDANLFATPQTITLTSGQLGIDQNLTIQGPGAGLLSIRGFVSRSRVFLIDSGVTAKLVGMTVRDGYGGTEFNGSGGGIYNLGVLTVIQSIVTANEGGRGVGGTAGHGGGIYNGPSGTLTISNTTVHSNYCQYGGGGIMNDRGTLTVTNSTIFGNSSINGGGFTNDGSLTITNSTISGNQAYYGGGFQNVQNGAGSRFLKVINSTIVGNYSNDQGGGISTHVPGVTLRNTRVSGNTRNGSPNDIWYYMSAIPSASHSLIGDAASSGGITNGVNGNIVGVNPLLGPLQNNGGPTMTHALRPGSPGIDSGNNCVLTGNGCGDGNPALPFDQRGMPRNGIVDIGAFELASSAPFDYDGDGKTDFSVWRQVTNQVDRDYVTWFIAESGSGNMRVGPTYGPFAFSVQGAYPVPADYDGDGKTDTAHVQFGTDIDPPPFPLYWVIRNSSNDATAVHVLGFDDDRVVPADYDGDGKADRAFWRPSDGVWNIALSQGGEWVQQWGLPDDKPVPADFDGDGRAELAVWRPSEGRWYTLNLATREIGQFNWGLDGDIPVPGDYSGDGKADYAVYRPSNNTWYRMHSDDFSIHIQTWGLPNDIVTPGDYDGDGKLDLAVWRPSNATWYVLNSTGFIHERQFGLTGDLPTPSAFIY